MSNANVRNRVLGTGSENIQLHVQFRFYWSGRLLPTTNIYTVPSLVFLASSELEEFKRRSTDNVAAGSQKMYSKLR